MTGQDATREDRAAKAARLYLDGATTRQAAAELGVAERTVRLWLDAQGVPRRPRGSRPRPDVDTAALAQARTAGTSWAQVAADAGMSQTGVRKRAQRAYGGLEVDLHAHLSAVQRRRLLAAWERLPVQPGPPTVSGRPGRVSAGAGGRQVRALLREHHAAGVTWAELGDVLGLSGPRVAQIAQAGD